MNRARYSRIAHEGIRFWNPLNEEMLVRILSEIPLKDGDAVLDYGCGDGEVLVELAKRAELRVTGIDVNPEAIERSRAKVPGTYLVEPFRVERFEPFSFDLVVNIGASPGFSQVVSEVMGLVRPGGRVLLGDGYWQKKPHPEYLAFLGCSESAMASHEENVELLEAAGFRVEKTVQSSLEDWDRYEDRYDQNMETHLRNHPDDPEYDEFEERRMRWRENYLRFGRGTMGFALYQAKST